MEPIFDRHMLIQRKLRAAAGQPATFLLDHAASELGERLLLVERHFARAVSLFESSGTGAAAVRASGKAGDILRIEAHEDLLCGMPGLVEADEIVPLAPASVDLAIALLSLHAVNDLPGMLIQIRRALAPDGLFIGVLPGAGTLQELRESLIAAESAHRSGVSPRVYPFIDVRLLGDLLQRAGFALPVIDMESLTVRYDSMFGLLEDLRAMGETSAFAEPSRQPLSRDILATAAEYYSAHFSEGDGRIRATFNLVWISGWAPDESQQKPLRPGSARMPLAEALGQVLPDRKS